MLDNVLMSTCINIAYNGYRYSIEYGTVVKVDNFQNVEIITLNGRVVSKRDKLVIGIELDGLVRTISGKCEGK